MFDDIKANVRNPADEEEVRAYLKKILHKEAFDHSGLIYGMGHAIYSISDPRAEVLKSFVEKLAAEKDRMEDFQLYSLVERLGPEVIAEERKIYKGVCVNVDFYSGFVYSILDLPMELFTPMFAVARIVGWSAHRLEELINVDKIIRPAYMNVGHACEYVPLRDR
jgi:citrate synthase